MTTDENKNEEKEDKTKAVSALVDKALALKTGKPKVFYGAIGGVVLLIIITMFSGGNPEVISERSQEQFSVGQTYTLKNPNAAGGQAMTSLIKEPCVLQGYDRSQNDDLYVCLAPAGTKVKILQLADAHGVESLCAQVKVTSPGECEGKEGWTLTNNID